MDSAAIQRYRAALFARRMAQMLGVARPRDGWMSGVAVDLIRSAVGMESPRESSFTDVSEISRSASEYLLMATEVQLMHSGELSGYYPDGVFEQASASIRGSASASIRESASWADPGEFDSLADLLDTYELDDRYERAVGLFLGTFPVYPFPVETYLAEEAVWRDCITPCLARCIELVMFTVEEVWERSIAEVRQLSRRLEQNPSLSVSPEEMDRVSWALTGAAELSATEPSSIRWSVVWQAFQFDLYETRTEQLDEVRSQILGLQDILTADESAAATRALLRPVPAQKAIRSRRSDPRRG